jgi:16S rRNA G966 N2-methylase RsmD
MINAAPLHCKEASYEGGSKYQTQVQADLHELLLSVDTFGTKFDVVLIDPPWEEYVRRAPGVGQGESWSWQQIKNLEIDKITDNPSFVFLW